MMLKLFTEKLPTMFQENPLALQESGLRSTCIGVELSGLGAWSFLFDEQGGVVLQQGLSQAQTEVQTSTETFSGILDGKVNVPWAYMTRKIKVKGETKSVVALGLALKKLLSL